MAYYTQTFLAHNVIGNRKEDYIGVSAAAASGEVKTRLHWIEEASVQTFSWDGSASSSGDQSMSVYLNTTDTTEGTTPGVIHLETVGTHPVVIRAVGW